MDYNYYNVIPAEEHIETAFPSKRGLYPHEILVLNFAPKYNTESEKFPQYWLYRYGIKNVSAILEDLYKKGFLKYADIGVTIGKHNAEELKSILKEHGLKVTGKKSVLVSRILENVSVSEIESIFTERYYDITDIGEKEIEENGYVMEIHNNSLLRMSIWDANIILHHNPDSSFDEIIEKQQQKELEKAINCF